MNRKITVSVALAITLIAMTVTFSITWLLSMHTFDNTVSQMTRYQAQFAKLSEIDTYVRGNFYGDIDDDYLFDRVAVGYMNGLGDRNSVYYSASEYNDLVAIENGTLVGVGLEVIREPEGAYRIVRVHEGSPAAAVGVMPQDRIERVNGEEARSFATVAALKRALMGEEGTELSLDCIQNISDEVSYTIRRSNYKAPTVETIVVGQYAYIRISAFDPTTESDFDFRLREAMAEDVKGIVFDVRGTSGGYFRDSYNIIDMLAPRGTVAKSVNKTGTVRVLATSDETYLDLPMAVLVNEGTAGPAELFAASVRDLCGGQIVGTTTAGKGTIQRSPQRLSDGSAVQVTESVLITGRDESFDKVGLTPDDVVDGEDVTELSLLVPTPTQDTEVMRAFEVVRAMVRERGGDPGPAITAGPAMPDGPATSGVTDASDVSGDDSLAAEDSSLDENGDSSLAEDSGDVSEEADSSASGGSSSSSGSGSSASSSSGSASGGGSSGAASG